MKRTVIIQKDLNFYKHFTVKPNSAFSELHVIYFITVCFPCLNLLIEIFCQRDNSTFKIPSTERKSQPSTIARSNNNLYQFYLSMTQATQNLFLKVWDPRFKLQISCKTLAWSQMLQEAYMLMHFISEHLLPVGQ